MSKPTVCVLKTDGINCDDELMYAFSEAGARPQLVHINQLRTGTCKLVDFDILAIPGGFSYGDDVASGKVLATELMSYLGSQLRAFVAAGKPVLGICNGFQVLIKAGLLPGPTIAQTMTLTSNTSGRFECRWVDLTVSSSVSKFISPSDFMGPTPMQVAHGEGRFFGTDADISALAKSGQIVFRYTTAKLEGMVGYPENPNGSKDNIAGICDKTGLVLGMMPHPERSLQAFHPHRASSKVARHAAQAIFKGIVTYASGQSSQLNHAQQATGKVV
jgi:phosphoribosylformylglycinamidine synthase I